MRSTGSRSLLLVLLVVVALPSCASRHEFLRISNDACGGKLEAAWVWFEPPPDCPPVVLVNMIHFGSPEYFDEVQAELDRSAFVFIEGITGRCAESAPAPRSNVLDLLDRATAELAFELRLVTQRDTLVTRPRYICADWTEDELLQRVSLDRHLQGISRLRETVQCIVDEEAAAMRTDYPGLSYEELAAFVRRGPLRRQVAEKLAEPPDEDATLILGRNEAVLRRLLVMGETGIVAICYGADHGPHLARSLEAVGYRRQCQTWHRVFSFDREPHPDVFPVP